MKKVIAINMTLDGFCDHTAAIPDEEIHQHYANLLRSACTALYGRIIYQLMEFWRTVLENLTGDKAMDDFAAAHPIHILSRTFQHLDCNYKAIQPEYFRLPHWHTISK